MEQKATVPSSMGNTSNPLILFPKSYNGVLTVISCSFSIIGSFSLIAFYWLRKAPRTLSSIIVMCIALADFFTASGYLVITSWLLHSGLLGRNEHFDDVVGNHTSILSVCEGQSFVTTTSSMWSFWWTTILAFHLNLSFVWQKKEFSRRLLPLYCLLGWVTPLLITIPVLATGWLGLGCGTVSVTWCFIGYGPDDEIKDCTNQVYHILEAIAGKMWEIGAFFFISVLYIQIWCGVIKARKKTKKDISSSSNRNELNPLLAQQKKAAARSIIDWTALLIPVVFLFIRSWGTLRYFLSLDKSVTKDLLNPDLSNLADLLVTMQTIFDPSQGWTNAVIFLILSKKCISIFGSCLKLVKQFFVICCQELALACRSQEDFSANA